MMCVALQSTSKRGRCLTPDNHRCAKTAHRTERLSDCFRPLGMGWSNSRTDAMMKSAKSRRYDHAKTVNERPNGTHG